MKTLYKSKAPLHPTFAPLNNCLKQDWFLLGHELRLQRVHSQTLRAAGILSGSEHAALDEALTRMQRELSADECPESDAEDIHTFVEARLVELAGEAGRKIHTARSRNDQVATLLKMYLLETGQQVGDELATLVSTAACRAKQWADLVMPMQTHAQFAAPGTAGFWMLRYATSFANARRHLLACRAQWRKHCPLGSGAVAGSSIAIDRALQARELGFASPSPNALESTSCRDECLQWLSVASQIALHVQSFATETIGFSQTPFEWVDYPAAFGTGSSMMPNKTNPDAMELLRGHCCAILAADVQAIMLLKGLPSGYNRDLQCIKPLVHEATRMVVAALSLTQAFVEALKFRAGRLADATSIGHIGATLAMEQQVHDGVPLRDAHHAVAEGLHATTASAGDVRAYRTIGSAHPEETLRVADALLREHGGAVEGH